MVTVDIHLEEKESKIFERNPDQSEVSVPNEGRSWSKSERVSNKKKWPRAYKRELLYS